MNSRAMEALIAHCNKYFGQSDPMILHPTGEVTPHIDVLLYEPSGKYPYWKLVTMGASDYKMPHNEHSLGNRNEYMILVDPSENLNDEEILQWYHMNLLEAATYAYATRSYVSYGHSFEWGEEEGSDMVGAYLEMPQFSQTVSFLRCKLGLLRQTVILQVIFLTRPEVDKLLEIGSEEFSNYLYPEDGGENHILCERYRSEKF